MGCSSVRATNETSAVAQEAPMEATNETSAVDQEATMEAQVDEKTRDLLAPSDICINVMKLSGEAVATVETSSQLTGAELKTQIVKSAKLDMPELSHYLLYKEAILQETLPISESGLLPGADNNVTIVSQSLCHKTQFVFSGITPGPRQAFDRQGLLYWLGCDRGRTQYQNPAEKGTVHVEWNSLYKGPKSAFVDNAFSDKADGADAKGICNRGDGWHHTNHGPGEHWMRVDLGPDVFFSPDHYCLRHGSSGKTGPGCWDLRKWKLQASNDPHHSEWVTLHEGAGSLVDGSCGAWSLQKPQVGYRCFRILMDARDHGGAWLLALGGIEFYGERLQQDNTT